jgi:hypothetical protein
VPQVVTISIRGRGELISLNAEEAEQLVGALQFRASPFRKAAKKVKGASRVGASASELEFVVSEADAVLEALEDIRGYRGLSRAFVKLKRGLQPQLDRES